MNDPANDEPGAAITDSETDARRRNDKTIQGPDDIETPLEPDATTFTRDAGVIAGESYQPAGESTGDFPTEEPPARNEMSTGRGAFFVGAGILISRIVGLVRQRVFAHYFGASAAGDAFAAAFRIPNFLQNVFGEGALSASFIPVYSKLLAQDNEEEASRVAGAILALLALVTSAIVLVGVLFTPYFIDLIAWGFEGEKRELTIRLARILFPGAGLLVISAWCLGVLNSHHRFFLSYTAPVVWNGAIIIALLMYGGRVIDFRLAEVTAWGSVIGSALQFGVQLPTVLRVVHRLRPVLDLVGTNVRTVIRNFLPVFVSRGVVQISAFVDAGLASLLPEGAVISLTYAQSLYTLPVSLFGMSVSAAELPAMSRAVGNVEQVADILRHRLDAGLRRIAFFIIPSSMAFLALGDVIAAVLYQTGKFKHADANYVWAILAGSTIGLLASTLGRLYSSTYYALHDTRTPLRYAIIRVTLTTVLGYLCAILLPPAIGLAPKWGVAGLTGSAGIAGWIEFALLRRTLNRRIGRTGLPIPFVMKLWAGASAGAAIAWGLKLLVPTLHPIPLAMVVLGAYGVTYFAVTTAFGLPEARTVVGRLLRELRITKH
jgi:putative peptidoglycan lipid II flippase